MVGMQIRLFIEFCKIAMVHTLLCFVDLIVAAMLPEYINPTEGMRLRIPYSQIWVFQILAEVVPGWLETPSAMIPDVARMKLRYIDRNILMCDHC